jgi:hypothetical protein
MKTKLSQLLIFLFLPIFIYPQVYLPGDNELLLMPTAYTMPVNTSYFSDYEVLLINYSYAVSPTTHLSAFSLFPVTTDFYQTFTFGIKQKIINYESIQSALFGAYTPKSTSFYIGDVVSIGKPNKSLHVSVAYLKYTEESDADWIYMLGFRIDPTEHISLLIEYENANSLIHNEFKGLLNFGVRIRSTNMSWEIAGIRPLADTGTLLLIPLIKVGYFFN